MLISLQRPNKYRVIFIKDLWDFGSNKIMAYIIEK